MKSVIISIKPEWCYKIVSGEKTIEVRKTRPKIETPFKCYIYCTSCRSHFSVGSGLYFGNDELYRNEEREIKYGSSIGLMACDNYDETYFLNRRVIGEFICDEIREYYPLNLQDMINKPYGDEIENSSCMTAKQITDYAWNGIGYGKLYGWHISALTIYDKPLELSEFYTFCDKCDESPIKCEYAYEENTENGHYSECGCDFKRPIKRPPQSWCYTEEPQDSNGEDRDSI